MKLSLTAKFSAKLSLLYLFFTWTVSTNHSCWYVYCSYKCSRAWCIYCWVSVFHILIFKKFMTFQTIAKRGWRSNGGFNSGSTRHDFLDNYNIYFLFFTMRTGPFPKCENQSNFMPSESLSEAHLRWEPSIQFSWWFSSSILIGWFSLRTRLKTGVGFS